VAEDDFPDVEGGVRDYLRGLSYVNTYVATRVFFGIPAAPVFPLITVTRVGGTDDTSEAAIDQALVQIDIWGRLYADTDPTHKGGDKAQCDAIRRAVRRGLRAIRGATALNASTVAYGARVESDPFRPDPDSDRPRYALTASITARAA
jgi:hypothetical protein